MIEATAATSRYAILDKINEIYENCPGRSWENTPRREYRDLTESLKAVPALHYAVWDLAAACKRHGLPETAKGVMKAVHSPFFELQYRKTHASREAFELYDDIALGGIPIPIALEMIGEAMSDSGLASQAVHIAHALSYTAISVEEGINLFSRICMKLIKLGEFNGACRIIGEDLSGPIVVREVVHSLLNQLIEGREYEAAFELFKRFNTSLHEGTENHYLSKFAEEFAEQGDLEQVHSAARRSDRGDFIVFCAIERLFKLRDFPKVLELSKLFSGYGPYYFANVALSLPEKYLLDFAHVLIELEKTHERAQGAYLRVIAKEFVAKNRLPDAIKIALEEPDLETRAWVGLAIIDELIKQGRGSEVAEFIVRSAVTNRGLVSTDSLNTIFETGRYRPVAAPDPVIEGLKLMKMELPRVYTQANAGKEETKNKKRVADEISA